MNKKPYHEVVANKLIEQLKQGIAPWQRPWKPGEPNAVMPVNPVTGKRYKGINAIQLMAENHSDQRWMTYKQAESAGAQVRRGEKGTTIQYWKFTEEKTKIDEQGKPMVDTEGKALKVELRLERPRVFYATVFNAEQMDGLPEQVIQKAHWNSIERAEQVLNASGAIIHHGESNRAFYRPSTDSIHLPFKSQFPCAENYYATALHELGHWTGHSSRLDRDLIHPFGSEGYAREELRAEIASMILGDELGLGHDPGQHVAYVSSWIKALEDDPLEIFCAAADAEKIHHFVLSLEQTQIQEQNTTQRVERDYRQALAVGIESVLNEIDYSSIHFTSLHDESIELALHHDGIHSISDVTGVQPGKFYDTAFETLSSVFGLTPDPDYPVNHNAYLERDFLVDEFVLAAEKRVMEHVQKMNSVENQVSISSPSDANPRTIAEGIAMLNAADLQYRTEDQNRSLEKTWLDIPFKQKDIAKELAGTLPNGKKAIAWDKATSRWFAHPGADLDKLKPWLVNPIQSLRAEVLDVTSTASLATDKTWLAVPYAQREAVKQLAGKLPDGSRAVEWDKAAKCWFAHAGADLDKLKPWLADGQLARQEPALSPEQEFSDLLKSVGCHVTGDHPVMDGQKHRISIEGDKQSEKSGFYVGHVDGHPAGYIKNNRTGVEIKWKSKGYSLSPDQKAAMQAELVVKQEARAAENANHQQEAAIRVSKKLAELMPVVTATPYLQAKGIEPQPGIFTDKENQTTCIPATDENGKLWTLQYIQEDGTKRFARNSRKEGCFHAIGGLDAIAAAPVIVISEGYATAVSVSEALGFSTVAAFDAGNLEAVARALHEKFPDKPIVIAGDDDQHLEIMQGINPGKTKAMSAAKAVNGIAVFPIFAPNEQERDPKKFTDFNDLATNSELGAGGVKRQVKSIVDHVCALKQSIMTGLDHSNRLERTVEVLGDQPALPKSKRAKSIG